MMRIPHDPQAVLDYAFDWATNGWLAAGETIAAYALSQTGGVVLNSDEEADGVVRVVVSGGTADTEAMVTCHIETSEAREDDRTIVLMVQHR